MTPPTLRNTFMDTRVSNSIMAPKHPSVDESQTERKIKTTIDLPEGLWKQFSIRVIEKYGGRKKNDVIEELIRKYLKESN